MSKDKKTTTKTTTTKKTATERNIYRMDAKSYKFTTVTESVARKELTTEWKTPIIDSYFDSGEVCFTVEQKNNAYYSTKKGNLTAYKKQLKEEEKALKVEQPFSVGDLVFNETDNRVGTVVDRDNGKLGVDFIENGKEKSVLLRAKKWVLQTKAQFNKRVKKNADDLALANAPKALSATEKKDKTKLEKQVIRGQKQANDGLILFTTSLSEIREKNYFRPDYETFKEYAETELRINPKNLHNYAQIGDFIRQSKIISGGKLDLSLTHNSAKALAIQANDIKKYLGLSKVEFGAIRPLIDTTLETFVSVAPRNDKGEIIATPRVIKNFTEPLRSVIKDGLVTIEGEQMTVEKAHNEGILNHAVKSELIETSAEQIRTSSALIAKDANKRLEDSQKQSTNTPQSTSKEQYEGAIPVIVSECSIHGKTEIQSIGNGHCQFTCKCRGRIDSGTGLMVIYEVEGKRVQ